MHIFAEEGMVWVATPDWRIRMCAELATAMSQQLMAASAEAVIQLDHFFMEVEREANAV
jgi:hypothetical protein